MTEEFREMTFREKPDISQIFLRQLDRTNQSIMSPDPSDFEAMARMTLKYIPLHWRKWVLEKEQSNRYNNVIERFDFTYFCGVPIGTPDNPMMKENNIGIPYKVERGEDGNINWDDPNIISPRFVIETVTDYEDLYDVIMEAAEKAGLTWRIDYREKQIPNPKIKITRKKTPYRKPRDEQEEKEESNTEG